MFSGGKDSNYAVKYALDKGWTIKYLLSVKPTRTDCYLFHFATVEHTKLQAEALGLRHHLLTCSVADPKKEAEIVRQFVVSNEKVDAVILGGTGLQATQIRSIQEALRPHKVEVFAAHSGEDHIELFEQMIKGGFKIMMTQYAAEGITLDWLGRVIDEKAYQELKKLSETYGFHLPAEGGNWDSFVIDGPTFKKRLIIEESEKVQEAKHSGYLVAKKIKLIGKNVVNDISHDSTA
jgi:diphthine-ammonia ligase